MAKDKRPDISITLSPAQVESVVRSAAQLQGPNVIAVVSGRFAAARAAKGAPPSMSLADFDPRFSRSLVRGLSLLTCFDAENEPRGVVEMA